MTHTLDTNSDVLTHVDLTADACLRGDATGRVDDDRHQASGTRPGTTVCSRKHAFARSGFSPDRRRGFPGTNPQVASGETGVLSGVNVGVVSYYDPTTAQFTTPDPLFSVTGSRYGYAGNDPVNGSDPSGLSWIDPCIGDTCASDVASGAVNATVTVGTAGTANCVRYVTCSGSTANAYYSAGDVVDFGARNRGTIATGIATGLCIVPGVGWASCAALQAGAYSVRAEQRVDQQGFSDSLGENLLDLGVTSMFFGVGSLPEAFGGFAGMSSSMEAFLKLLLSGPDIARSIGEACSG